MEDQIRITCTTGVTCGYVSYKCSGSEVGDGCAVCGSCFSPSHVLCAVDIMSYNGTYLTDIAVVYLFSEPLNAETNIYVVGWIEQLLQEI